MFVVPLKKLIYHNSQIKDVSYYLLETYNSKNKTAAGSIDQHAQGPGCGP